jgi:hypothetical protein
MFVYLGLYWQAIGSYAPLLVTQIIFGYLCDMLIAWTRGRCWRMGAGILPIVFSTNLFLWFQESVFYWQFVLIFATFAGKELVTWNYGGRRRHIVNPSALSLSVASFILLATDNVNMSHAVDIAVAFDAPPNFFEVIFLLGLVVQALFVVTPVTFGAASALYLVFLLSPAMTGFHLTSSPIPSAAVFLGMTFLVTDPATSPRTHFGRFLFGFGYGITVVLLFIALRLLHQPAIFDKMLAVPLLNLAVPLIDRFSAWLSSFGWAGAPGVAAKPTNLARFGWLAAYVGLFAIMLPALKAPNKDRTLSVLPTPTGHLSPDVEKLSSARTYCRIVFPEAFLPFGFRAEIAHSHDIRKYYRTGGANDLPPGVSVPDWLTPPPENTPPPESTDN